MRLNDPLATSINFKETEYPLDLSYDNVLDVLDVLKDNRLDLIKKVQTVVFLFIGENDLTLEDQTELWSAIRSEYIEKSSGEIETDELGNILPIKTSKKLIDLEYDAKYIYASFRQIGINLFAEQGKMHWEEFQALLESLPEDTIIQKIVQIRTWEPSKGESAKEKRRMRELKHKYALPGSREEEDDG